MALWVGAETGLVNNKRQRCNDGWKQSVPLPGRCARPETATATATTTKQTACRARNLHLDEFNDDDENDATKIFDRPTRRGCLKEPTDIAQHNTAHDIAMKTMGRCGSVTAAAVDVAVAVAAVG